VHSSKAWASRRVCAFCGASRTGDESRRGASPSLCFWAGPAFLLLVRGGSAAGCSGGVLGGGRDHPPRRSLPLPAGSSTRRLQVHWFRHTAAPLSIQWVEIHQELTAVSSFAGQEILLASLFFQKPFCGYQAGIKSSSKCQGLQQFGVGHVNYLLVRV